MTVMLPYFHWRQRSTPVNLGGCGLEDSVMSHACRLIRTGDGSNRLISGLDGEAEIKGRGEVSEAYKRCVPRMGA